MGGRKRDVMFTVKRVKRADSAIYIRLRRTKLKSKEIGKKGKPKMALRDQYNDSENSDFHAKIIVAMAKKAGEKLQAADPADPDYKRLVNLSRGSLGVNSYAMRFAARIFAANDVNNSSSDAAIQTAVNNNFDALAYIFDPDVPRSQ